MQRYFAIDKDLMLSKEDIYHIKNVMRMKQGNQIEVVWLKQVYLCKIDSIEDKKINISIIKLINKNYQKTNIILVVSLIKEQKFNLLLQKATELGVNTIVPVITDYSIIKLDKEKKKKKIIRWERICKEAAEQSKRIDIPEVRNIININELLIDDSNSLKLICSLNNDANEIKDILKNNKKYDKIIIVIGPEGGLSTEEEKKLVDKGFIKVSLGNKILRTETVPLYLLSIIDYEFMR